jgi:hypothetical protein
MITAETTVQKSPGLISRMKKSVGDTVDNLKRKGSTAGEGKSGTTARVNDAYVQAKGKIGLRDYQKMAQMLVEWLPTLVNEPLAKKLKTEIKATTSWVTDLPEEELESFVRRHNTKST